ncbi:hypothetical protein BGW38_004193, partial [Lunasporangiospora selenospora]
IASGSHYVQDGVPPPIETTFDIRAVFPVGFEFRDQTVLPLHPVATIPDPLPEHLDAKKKKRHDHSAVAGVSRLNQGVQVSTNATHKVWESIVDRIALSSNTLPVNVNDRSSTVNEHLTQMETNIGNIWSGPTYDKLLDRVLFLLLQLYLAPEREQKQRGRSAKQRVAKTSPKLEATSDKRATMGRHDHQRIQSVLNKIVRVPPFKYIAQPDGVGCIKPFEVRLGRLNTTVESTVRAGPSKETGTRMIDPTVAEPTVDGTSLDAEEMEMEDFEDIDFDDWDLEVPVDSLDQVLKVNKDPDTNSSKEIEAKEPSRAVPMSLRTVLRKLLESSTIGHAIDGNWVKKSARGEIKFTNRQCSVVAKLANVLRHFVAKRRIDGDAANQNRTRAPLAHVALMASMAIIANAILRSSGYAHFTRLLSPQIPPPSSSTHALLLGAKGMYETLCSRAPGHFDIHDSNGLPLTNGNTVPDHKEAVFGAFFDLTKINRVCRKHGLNQYQKHKAGKTWVETMDLGHEAELQKLNGAEILERLEGVNN